MKWQAVSHPKMEELARRLGICRCFAVGVMESLWNFAATHYPTGFIPQANAKDLAESLRFEGDKIQLVRHLVAVRFLDKVKGGYLIHDWPEHCEDRVNRSLARSAELFADGSMPSFSRLTENEKRTAEAAYREKFGRAHTVPPKANSGRPTDTDTDTSTLTDTPDLPEEADQSADPSRTDRRGSGGRGGGVSSVGRSAELHSSSGEEEPGRRARPGPEPGSGGDASGHRAGSAARPPESPPEAREAFNRSTPAQEEYRPVADGVGGGLGLPGNQARKTGEPVAVGDMLAGVARFRPSREGPAPRGREDQVRAQAQRICGLTGERVDLYLPWWCEVVRRCGRDTSARVALEDAVRYVENCMDPAARKRKDLGELKKPGAYIASKLMEAGVKLPPKPAVRARGWGQAC